MQNFTVLTGITAPLNMINVDTDKIIPKLHLRTTKARGSARGCSRSCATGKTAPSSPTSSSTTSPAATAALGVACVFAGRDSLRKAQK